MPVLLPAVDRGTPVRVRRVQDLPRQRGAGGACGSAAPEEDVRVEESRQTAEPWTTIVWNDPVNLMSYVTYVFRSYFGYSQQKAERLMLQVHQEGRATVSHGTREQMETDVQALHGFGLWATVQSATS